MEPKVSYRISFSVEMYYEMAETFAFLIVSLIHISPFVLLTFPSAAETDHRKAAPSILLPHQSEYVSHIALDIGGSLIKLIYFSRDRLASSIGPQGGQRGGKLHFVKFESNKVDECIDFIESKGLHRRNGSTMPMRVKATGGGSFKYAEVRLFSLSDSDTIGHNVLTSIKTYIHIRIYLIYLLLVFFETEIQREVGFDLRT